MRGVIRRLDVLLHSWTVIREYGWKTWWYVLFHDCPTFLDAIHHTEQMCDKHLDVPITEQWVGEFGCDVCLEDDLNTARDQTHYDLIVDDWYRQHSLGGEG